MSGKKNWYFPDAELPPMGNDPSVYGHEAIVILNAGRKKATVSATLYFTDKEPVSGLDIEVEPGRVKGIRITQKDGFLGYPLSAEKQYAIGLKSNVSIIAQYGRLDVRQPNMAFYTTMGYKK